jgi:hypothetical protein
MAEDSSPARSGVVVLPDALRGQSCHVAGGSQLWPAQCVDLHLRDQIRAYGVVLNQAQGQLYLYVLCILI